MCAQAESTKPKPTLTGQYHWRLEPAASLYGPFLDEFATYVEILEGNGCFAGSTGKAWGLGRPRTRGRSSAGKWSKEERLD